MQVHASRRFARTVIVTALVLGSMSSGASHSPARAAHGGIEVTKTVAIDATPDDAADGPCATESSIQVPQGTIVAYCFEITNHDDVTLTSHTLVDAQFGTILDDFAYALAPGASAFIIQQTVVNQTTTRSATWTATGGGETHADSASATVTVNGPALTLTMGVMVDPTPANDGDDTCSSVAAIQVPATSSGTEVDYCFNIRNNTNQILDRHDLTDSKLGSILANFAYALAPGASAFITQSSVVTYRNDAHTGTWTARNDDESYTVTDTATTTALLPFTDIAASKFLGDIVWLDEQNITAGCSASPPRFCPDGLVTRGQMATFLSRALGLPPTGVDFFTDDETNKHEANINRVAAAGITVGCAPDRFCPDGLVTRGQMATFLSRAFNLPATGVDFFTDDETNRHEANINRVAAAGITVGCASSRYCPNGLVTRGQMSAFLHRADD